mmetsp:Transcript_25844/g.74760  ORF Transcript_25844/g.74760 Transcript_25844/m.74760 type:complete len:99 (+) Transcript_25844:87-383(+)
MCSRQQQQQQAAADHQSIIIITRCRSNSHPLSHTKRIHDSYIDSSIIALVYILHVIVLKPNAFAWMPLSSLYNTHDISYMYVFQSNACTCILPTGTTV